MLSIRRGWPGVIALVAVVASNACDSPSPTQTFTVDNQGALNATRLLACESTEALTAEGLAVPDSAVEIKAGAFKVKVPAGAVAEPTLVRLTVPASSVVEVILQAGDSAHYKFSAPLTVTLSYARCPVAPVGPLVAWYWDRETGELLEAMPTWVSSSARTLSFTTDHFSGFTIAN